MKKLIKIYKIEHGEKNLRTLSGQIKHYVANSKWVILSTVGTAIQVVKNTEKWPMFSKHPVRTVITGQSHYTRPPFDLIGCVSLQCTATLWFDWVCLTTVHGHPLIWLGVSHYTTQSPFDLIGCVSLHYTVTLWFDWVCLTTLHSHSLIWLGVSHYTTQSPFDLIGCVSLHYTVTLWFDWVCLTRLWLVVPVLKMKIHISIVVTCSCFSRFCLILSPEIHHFCWQQVQDFFVGSSIKF